MGLNSARLTLSSPVIAARLQEYAISSALLQELEHLSALPWVAHVNHRDYQGDWQVLPLRSLEIHHKAHPILQGFAHDGGGDWRELPVLEAAPCLQALLKSIPTHLKSARLMRLGPGAQIKPHRDVDIAWESGEARLHLPLRTDPRVMFRVGGKQVPMGLGELWYMDASEEHSVINASPEERIHLVVDCEVNEWLRSAVAGRADLNFITASVDPA
jgi:hypothetical protein